MDLQLLYNEVTRELERFDSHDSDPPALERFGILFTIQDLLSVYLQRQRLSTSTDTSSNSSSSS